MSPESVSEVDVRRGREIFNLVKSVRNSSKCLSLKDMYGTYLERSYVATGAV